jgi:hypothetical protein
MTDRLTPPLIQRLPTSSDSGSAEIIHVTPWRMRPKVRIAVRADYVNGQTAPSEPHHTGFLRDVLDGRSVANGVEFTS